MLGFSSIENLQTVRIEPRQTENSRRKGREGGKTWGSSLRCFEFQAVFNQQPAAPSKVFQGGLASFPSAPALSKQLLQDQHGLYDGASSLFFSFSPRPTAKQD